MNENFSSNSIKNDDFNISTEESEYKNLTIKLKEISATISLIEKKYIEKI